MVQYYEIERFGDADDMDIEEYWYTFNTKEEAFRQMEIEYNKVLEDADEDFCDNDICEDYATISNCGEVFYGWAIQEVVTGGDGVLENISKIKNAVLNATVGMIEFSAMLDDTEDCLSFVGKIDDYADKLKKLYEKTNKQEVAK